MAEKPEEERLRKILERQWKATFTVEESYAKAVMRFGAFQRFEMSWKGYQFDENWNVKKTSDIGAGQEITGGLHTKWPGTEKIFVYRFRWKDIQFKKEGKDVTELHEKLIDYIFLKPAYYAFEVEKAETLAIAEKTMAERIPVTLHVSVLLRVVNPYKALFRGTPNWFENAATRLASMLRDWVAQKKLDEVLSFRRDPEETWKAFKENAIVKALEKDWGIRVEKNGLDIRDVDLPKEYQEAAALEKKREFEAQAIATESIGAILESMAKARGIEVEDIQEEIKASDELKKELREKSWDYIIRKMEVDQSALLDIRTQNSLLDIAAVWATLTGGQPFPFGGGKQKKPPEESTLSEEGKKKRKKKVEEMTTEELEKDFEEITGLSLEV
jgi:regulator of protease activity HflC (stomatin/prohibitin superfamily)